MCARLLLFCLFCLPLLPYSAYAQDANQRTYYITETQLQNIEKLAEKSEADRRSWELQARELRSEAESLNAQLRQERERYGTLEKSFYKLEDSRSAENQEKDAEILRLTQDNAKQMTAIFIMGGIILLVLAYFIIRLILWINLKIRL